MTLYSKWAFQSKWLRNNPKRASWAHSPPKGAEGALESPWIPLGPLWVPRGSPSVPLGPLGSPGIPLDPLGSPWVPFVGSLGSLGPAPVSKITLFVFIKVFIYFPLDPTSPWRFHFKFNFLNYAFSTSSPQAAQPYIMA